MRRLGGLALLDMCREPEPFETFEDPGGWSLQSEPRSDMASCWAACAARRPPRVAWELDVLPFCVHTFSTQ
eukprot:4052623-Prymnesium_polylepis.2